MDVVEHVFRLESTWNGGRNNIGEIKCGQLNTKVSIPKEMNGPGVGTNPDEMLLSAASTCYLISLATMLDYSKIKASLSLHSEGIVQTSNHIFTYKKIIHNIKIFLQDDSEQNIRIANRLALKAEKSCMISKALKGNVEITVNCSISKMKLNE